MESKINILSKKKNIFKIPQIETKVKSNSKSNSKSDQIIQEKKIIVKENLSEEEFNKKYNKPIKIKTTLKSNYLFHYAHFMIDFIFPLICTNNHNYLEIIREKTINQTIGNFNYLAKEIIGKNYEEIPTDEYINYPAQEVVLPLKEDLQEKDFLYFQQEMVKKFVKSDSKENWPEIILIKRTKQNILNEE